MKKECRESTPFLFLSRDAAIPAAIILLTFISFFKNRFMYVWSVEELL